MSELKIFTRILLATIPAWGCAVDGEDDSSVRSVEQLVSGAEASLTINSQWETGYCAEILVQNTSPDPIPGFEVAVDLNDSVDYTKWGGTFSGNAPNYTITQPSWMQQMYPGQTQSIGFCANKTGADWMPELGSDEGGLTCDDTVPFHWPMTGIDRVDWVINNYVDLDPSGAILDYEGGTRSYNGHAGIDIDVATFRQMDNFEAPVHAIAAGTVEVYDMHQDDRHLSCVNYLHNEIRVVHDNGWVSRYLHLKTGSDEVVDGQRVEAGDLLAYVGSSGCSSQPHLHLEIRDCAFQVVDPYDRDLWVDASGFVSAPEYVAPTGYMDIILREGAFSSDGAQAHAELIDPGENITEIALGSVLGVGPHFGGSDFTNDTEIIVRDSSGQIFFQELEYFGGGHWAVAFATPPLAGPTGTWSVEVLLNGTSVDNVDFEVVSP